MGSYWNLCVRRVVTPSDEWDWEDNKTFEGGKKELVTDDDYEKVISEAENKTCDEVNSPSSPRSTSSGSPNSPNSPNSPIDSLLVSPNSPNSPNDSWVSEPFDSGD